MIIDTGNTALYYVLGQGRAIRYGVGVGREGFTWAGMQTISRKAEWPDWHPPAQMIARQPYLPRFMAGGPGNPLGARAMYLGSSEYRIHGTNDPTTIGKFVSSGCIRLTNEDVADLFSRVDVGTKVVVLPKNAPHLEARAAITGSRRGDRAVASGRDDAAVGPSGDEPFDVVALLRLQPPSRETNMVRRSVRLMAFGAAVVCALGARSGGAGRGLSLRAVRRVRRRPAACARRCRCPLPARASRRPPHHGRAPRIELFRRPGLLRAHLRRALFPDHGDRQPEPGGVVQQFLPGQRDQSGLWRQYRHAATETGKPYSELPNAFRYRNEIVAGCTCNGKDQIGLAPVKIEDDPTLRKGDIVAGADGLMVAGHGADRRGASLNFSPASESVRARVPVVASE